MTRWLVRTTTNEIHGPFTREQLVQSIGAGRWNLQDEACRENHYWFTFRESQELQSQLGIFWPGTGDSAPATEERTDEITDTQTLPKEVQSPPELFAGAGKDVPESLISEPRSSGSWWSQPEFLLALVLAAGAVLGFFFSR